MKSSSLKALIFFLGITSFLNFVAINAQPEVAPKAAHSQLNAQSVTKIVPQFVQPTCEKPKAYIKINTIQDFLEMSDSRKSYILCSDLDFTSIFLSDVHLFQGEAFQGHFFGNDYTISNLTVTSLNSNSALLERIGEMGRVTDLNFEDSITTSLFDGVASIITESNAGLIKDVGFSHSTVQGNTGGALVAFENEASGRLQNIRIYNSSASDGGALLVGINHGDIHQVSVRESSASTFNFLNSGVVSINRGQIRDVSSFVDVDATGYGAGIAAINYGSVTNSFSVLEDNRSRAPFFGGIAGFNAEGGLLAFSYSLGLPIVETTNNSGIVIPLDQTFPGQFSFESMTSLPRIAPVYEFWDFSEVWYQIDGEFPILRTEACSAGDLNQDGQVDFDDKSLALSQDTATQNVVSAAQGLLCQK